VVDDAEFDFGWHVRRATVPAPGGPDALAELVGQELSRRLDRSRPLWEVTVVEALGRRARGVLPPSHVALGEHGSVGRIRGEVPLDRYHALGDGELMAHQTVARGARSPPLGTTSVAFALVARRDAARPSLGTIVGPGGPGSFLIDRVAQSSPPSRRTWTGATSCSSTRAAAVARTRSPARRWRTSPSASRLPRR
jgi:hypothetical protein